MLQPTRAHILSLLILLLPIGAVADVYKFVDKHGNVTYTDNPTHAGFKRIIDTPEPFSQPVRVTFGGEKSRGGGTRSRRITANLGDGDGYGSDDGWYGRPARPSRGSYTTERNRQQYTDLIDQAANRHGLDPALLHAVIRAESSYNPEAVSHKGAMGLMQLMPGTAARYGVQNPYDPQDNVLGGARYLSDLLDMFDSDVALAVAAYNAGENNVIKYGNRVPPFAETRDYVSKVLSYYYR